MLAQNLEYRADGLPMTGRLFIPDDRHDLPGVLVFPEAFGRNDQAVTVAERLAERGYATLACDLHGHGQVAADLPTALDLIAPLFAEPARLLDRAAAALQALATREEVNPSRIGAVGYSIGGLMALELARSGADLGAVIGFHCPLAPRAPSSNARAIKGRVLMCIGADDPQITFDDRAAFEREMRDADVVWQLEIYGKAVHSFTNPQAAALGLPEAVRYDRAADASSWSVMEHVLAETLR